MLLNPNDPDYQQKLAAAQNVAPRDRATNALYENVGSIGGGGLTQDVVGGGIGSRFSPTMVMPGYDTPQQMGGPGLVGGSGDVRQFADFGDDLGILGRPTPFTGGQLSGMAGQRPTSFQNETPQPIGTFNTQMGSAQDDPLFNLRQYNSQNSPSNAYQNIPSQGFGGASQSFGQGANGYSAAGASSGGVAGAGGGAVFPLQGNYGIVKLQSGGAVGQMQTPDKIQFISSNMYPGSQQDRTQYATPTQMPASAQAVAIKSDYDAKVNPITGEPMASYASGGIAALRYADGGQVDYNARAQALANDVYSRYGKNQNYDEQLNELNAIVEKDPAAFYKARMNLYGKQMGWQTGQNTGDRNAVLQKELETLIPGAKAAGLSDEEISSLVGSGANVGNIENQRRIAEEAAKGKGWVNQNIPGGWATVGALAAAAAAPYAIGALAGEGALGAGALGAAEGGGALTTTELLGGAGGSFVPAGGASFSIVPEAAYGVAEGIGAGEAASNMLPSLKDAYKAYSYGKKGLGILNALSGAGGPAAGRGYAGSSGMGGGQSPFPGSANIAYRPNVHGYTGLGSFDSTEPLSRIIPPVNLSKLSEFKYDAPYEMAAGGITTLGSYSDGGRLLRGPGDGMSDHIPATIGDKQPARLADGEFVIPADVVSHLGNGSTDAGAKQLYKMMDKIRRARTGNPKQGKQINPDKFTPKG